MLNILGPLMACMPFLVTPLAALAADRSPLDYPLSQYGLMLGTALLGGLVSWYSRVRKGELPAWNLMQLIGELATSAFAGLIAFWMCEAFDWPPLITASMVGIAGHMGTRAIVAAEAWARRRVEAIAVPIAAPIRPAPPATSTEEPRP